MYKELLYTIAHKLGKPSTTEVFTDSQLHQYIKEVRPLHSHIYRITHNSVIVLVYDEAILSCVPGFHYDRVRAQQSAGESAEHRGEKEKSAYFSI